jgi:hypothetical protein
MPDALQRLNAATAAADAANEESMALNISLIPLVPGLVERATGKIRMDRADVRNDVILYC